MTMAEPGTTVLGDARNRPKVAASQVKLAARSAAVYENPAALAACRPYTPVSEGPCAPPLSPGSAVWQILQCWVKNVLPAVASAPSAGALAARSPRLIPNHTVTKLRLIRYSARKPGPLGRGGSAAPFIELP